jgi:PAS domain S-box-containing protein
VSSGVSGEPTIFDAHDLPSVVVRILSIGATQADVPQVHGDAAGAAAPRIDLTCVESFPAALELIAGHRFDIILADLVASGATGPDVLAALRQCTPDSAIILVASQHLTPAVFAALEAGWADGVLNDSAGASVRRVVQKVSEIARVQASLRESEDRYRTLLQSVTSYVYTVQVKGGHPVGTRHGPGCAATTGYSAEDYARDAYLWLRMIHPDDRDNVLKHVHQVLSGSRVPPIEHRIFHRDGLERWVRDTIVPRYSADGQLLEYDGVVEDITERKRAEEMLRHRDSFLLAARRIQQSFLPTESPLVAGFDFAGAVHPAEFVAGDFFDYLYLPDGTMGIVVGDVMGHGFGPALIMAETHVTLRSLAASHVEVSEILGLANSILSKEMKNEHFITLCFARLDPADRRLTYISAGHPTGYVLDAIGQVKATLSSTSIPLAVLADTNFHYGCPVSLTPGDVVLLPTDGVLEATNAQLEVFGTQRLLESVRKHIEKPARSIVTEIHRAIRSFVGGADLRDDVTVLVVKVAPAAD